LNSIATVLLVTGYMLIRRRAETAHKTVMLTAFGVSVLFLVSYLVYHNTAGHVEFTGPSPVREIYYGMLLSHVILAATVPFLAIATIWLGLRDRRIAHRKLARWTLPIWLYVSITGVIIYLLLYQVYGSTDSTAIMTSDRPTSAGYVCDVQREDSVR
jgi:uncharacterized membrane protein YozB (DUF420 family)